MKPSLFLLAGTIAAVSLVVACSDDDTDAGVPAALDSNVDSGTTPPTTPEDAAAPEDEDGGNTPADAGSTECMQTVAAATTATFVELCKPAAGNVKHVRLEGVQAPTGHKYASVLFNYADTPIEDSVTGPVSAEQGRVVLYGGNGMRPPPLLQASFAAKDETVNPNATFINTAGTVCFDVTDGSADVAPVVTFWATGQKGADCTVRSTLTAASAVGTSTTLAKGVFPKAGKMWFGANSSPAVNVVVSSVSAL